MQSICNYSTYSRDHFKEDNSSVMSRDPSDSTSVHWYDKGEEKLNEDSYVTSYEVNQINDINKKKVYPYYFSTDSNSSYVENQEKLFFNTDSTSNLIELSMRYLSCPRWSKKESGENVPKDVCNTFNYVNNNVINPSNPMKISFQIAKPSHYLNHQQRIPMNGFHKEDIDTKPYFRIWANPSNQCKKNLLRVVDSDQNQEFPTNCFYQDNSNYSLTSQRDDQKVMFSIETLPGTSSHQERNTYMDKVSACSQNNLTFLNPCDSCRPSAFSLPCEKKRTPLSSFFSTPKRSDVHVPNKNGAPSFFSTYRENDLLPPSTHYSSQHNLCSVGSSSSSSTVCSSTPLSLSGGIDGATQLSTPCIQLHSPISQNFLTHNCNSSTSTRSSSPTFDNIPSPYMWKKMCSSPVKDKYDHRMEADSRNHLTQCNTLNNLSTSESHEKHPVTKFHQCLQQNTLDYQLNSGTFLHEKLRDKIHQTVKNTHKPFHEFSCHPHYQIQPIDSNYPHPKQNTNGMIAEGLQSLTPLKKSWFQNINTPDIAENQLQMPPEYTYSFDAKLTVCPPVQGSVVSNSIKTKGPNGRSSTEYLCSFPGVSWNTRMQSWLVYYEDINGRKSKTFNPKRYSYEKLSSYGYIDENLRQYNSLSLAMHCACAFAAKVRYRAKLYKHSGVTMGRSGVKKSQKLKKNCLKSTPYYNEFITKDYSVNKKLAKYKNMSDNQYSKLSLNCPTITRQLGAIPPTFNNRESLYTDAQIYDQNATYQGMAKDLSFNQ